MDPTLGDQLDQLGTKLVGLLAELDEATEGLEITPRMRELADRACRAGEVLIAMGAQLGNGPPARRARQQIARIAGYAIVLDRDINRRDVPLQ